MESANNAVNAESTASQERLHANIAYIFDDNYAPITGASATSLLENNKDLDEITIYLLVKNLSEENTRRFKQLGEMYNREIVFVDISNADVQFKQMGLNSNNNENIYVTYMKLFCVDYVPKDVKQLIYMDSDTIVVDSIKPILAVKGLLGMVKGGMVYRAQSAVDYEAPYACAVLVFDAERWRNEKWSEKLLEHAKREGKRYLVPDENILSIVVKDEIVKLPLEFCFGVINCAFSKEDYIDLHPCEEYTPEEAERAYAHPIIIHSDKFLGEKPWLQGNNHPNKELFTYWFEHSLWKDFTGGGSFRRIRSQDGEMDVPSPSQKMVLQDLERGAVGSCQENGEKADESVTEDQSLEASGARPKCKDRKSAHIVYVFDNSYAAIGGVSITSLFENNQDIDEMTVYILSDGFSEENEKRFAQLAEMYKREIVCMDVSEKIAGYKSMGLKPYRGTYITYLKMFFPDFFPKNIERMIYIDADTVILRSIAPLLESDALLGMVKHSIVTFTGKTAGYDAPYNSQLLVFNATRWRNEGWSAKLIDFVRKNGADFLAADEGILNMVCRDEIEKLPLEYAFDVIFCAMPKENFLAVEKNMYYTPEEIAHAYDEPVVIHMGVFFNEKPWQQGTMHPAKGYFDTWLARSLWKDYERPAINSSVVFSVEKWLYKKLPKRLFYKMWILSQKYCVVQKLKRLRSESTE